MTTINTSLSQIHVSFDCWGTLMRANPSYGPARDEAIAAYVNTEPSRVRRVTAEVKKTLTYAQYGDPERYGWTARQCFQSVCKHLGVSSKRYADAMVGIASEKFIQYPPTATDMSHELLHILRTRGAVLSITSNTCFVPGHLLAWHLNREFGPTFNAMRFSDGEFGAKPGIAMFANAMIQEPTRLLIHVGDDRIADEVSVAANLVYTSPVMRDFYAQSQSIILTQRHDLCEVLNQISSIGAEFNDNVSL